MILWLSTSEGYYFLKITIVEFLNVYTKKPVYIDRYSWPGWILIQRKKVKFASFDANLPLTVIMPTSSSSSLMSNGHKTSLRSTGSCSPSPSISSLSPKTSLVYRSGSLSPKTSLTNGNGYNGIGYGNYGYYYNGNGSMINNNNPGPNGSHSNVNSPSSVNHNSCILVNGGQRKLSNSYLRFQRRYSKHGWDDICYQFLDYLIRFLDFSFRLFHE